MFPDFRNDLLQESGEELKSHIHKCPELRVKLNNVPVTALIDTGSAMNGISEDWFQQNKYEFKPYEILGMVNTRLCQPLVINPD